VLEGAKRTIFVATTQNEVVIVIERRCNITLEDFQNVCATSLQQLAIAEDASKVVQ
jgi:hypothetical protein